MSETVDTVGISRTMFIAGIIVSILASSLISVVIIPSLTPKGWHEVVRFYGTGNESADFFEINDMHWRIHWYVVFTPYAPEDSKFYFNISSRHSFSFPEINALVGMASGEEYFTETEVYRLNSILNLLLQGEFAIQNFLCKSIRPRSESHDSN